jgi:pimeloyl-ACP methyl ester carboxylesterase
LRKKLRKMMMLWIIAVGVVMLSGSRLHAQQNIAGDWQGTLKVGATASLRIVLHITKSDNGGWSAVFYSIDQAPDGIPVSSVTLQGSDIKFSIDLVHGDYEGKLSANGDSIKGTWTQGRSLPLDFQRATKETMWQRDSSPHTISFITVDSGVKLEVLDWGGSGRTVVFLAGLGNNAHVFDKFAPKFTPAYHVCGITRRGFGDSSAPAPANGNYSADRLGDDVLAVIDSLKLTRPILVGHSIAGEELSSIGSRHPEKVAGLIYLDAGYPYAYYDPSLGGLTIDSNELRNKLDLLSPIAGSEDRKRLVQELLQTRLPRFEKDLQEELKDLQVQEPSPANSAPPQMLAVVQAILAGEQEYTDIRVPALAIYALPHAGGPVSKDPATRAAAEARDLLTTGAQAKAFENGVHSARVVRLAHANHYVFLSNEPDVLREMNAFLSSLP